MNVRQISDYLIEASKTPASDSPDLVSWLELTDAIEFLSGSTTGDVPVDVIGRNFFAFSMFVPRSRLIGNFVHDILEWNLLPDNQWGYGLELDETTHEPRMTMFPPLDHTNSKILDNSEPLFFHRFFQGFADRSNYVEMNQRFAQISDIHWVPRRDAFCKLDDRGDFSDVSRVMDDGGIRCCTVQRDALDFYMFLTDSVLIRVFDVTRFSDPITVASNERTIELYEDKNNGLYAQKTTVVKSASSGSAAWMRGFQILEPQKSEHEMMSDLASEIKQEREYATFIAQDWKHNDIRECSSDPSNLGNYFVQSDLPYGTSPAFFNPEVLSKYKHDPDKYSIGDRMITCRGAWDIRYDINREGQVHAFLTDLGHLPFQEQLYWKSFNENPKGSISERSYMTDFKGQWYTSNDPLQSLKRNLETFPSATYRDGSLHVWSLPTGFSNDDLSRLTYVVTESRKEWQDQILLLAKVIVEGLRKPTLRKIATYLQCDDSQLGSIKLLKTCLQKKQIEASRMEIVTEPLESLWHLRSSIAAHAGGSVPDEDLKLHYRQLALGCDTSMQELASLIREHYLDVP